MGGCAQRTPVPAPPSRVGLPAWPPASAALRFSSRPLPRPGRASPERRQPGLCVALQALHVPSADSASKQTHRKSLRLPVPQFPSREYEETFSSSDVQAPVSPSPHRDPGDLPFPAGGCGRPLEGWRKGARPPLPLDGTLPRAALSGAVNCDSLYAGTAATPSQLQCTLYPAVLLLGIYSQRIPTHGQDFGVGVDARLSTE